MVDQTDLDRIAARINTQVKTGEPERKPLGAKPETVEQENDDGERSAEVEEREEPGSGEESAHEAHSAVDPDLERARKGGWRPKDEWDGPADEWVSHKTFLKNGELYDSIKTLKRKDAERDQAVKDLIEHNKRLADALSKARKADIEAQRDEAIEAGDKERVRKLEQEAAAFDASLKAPEVQPAPVIEPVYQQWVDSNDWFKSDPERRDFAIAFYELQMAKGRGADALPDVTEAVKRAFPDRFGKTKEEPKERRMSGVEAPVGRAPVKKTKGYSDLPEHAKEVAKKFERLGTMKRDEYAKQFFEMEQ